MVKLGGQVPTDAAGLRAFLALHGIRHRTVCRKYGKSGCARSWVSMLLNGRRKMTPAVLAKVRFAVARAARMKSH
jgi:hypothetical protein